jgi:hypothetical protein
VPARGVLAYLARAQGTVGDGLRAFARFAADAWGADDVVQVAERDAHAVVELRVDRRCRATSSNSSWRARRS